MKRATHKAKVVWHWQKFADACAERAGVYVVIALVGLLVWLYRIDKRQSKILDIVQSYDTTKVNRTDFTVFKLYFEGQLAVRDEKFKQVEKEINRILTNDFRSRGDTDTSKVYYYGIFKRPFISGS